MFDIVLFVSSLVLFEFYTAHYFHSKYACLFTIFTFSSKLRYNLNGNTVAVGEEI